MDQIIQRHTLKHQLEKHNEIVLGCTHYELVKSMFEKQCPNTRFISNSKTALNDLNINISSNELNIVVLTSKKDRELEDKILKLI